MVKYNRFVYHLLLWGNQVYSVLQLTGISRVNFGIMNGSYVIGYITNGTLSQHKFDLFQLLTGAGWLVRS